MTQSIVDAGGVRLNARTKCYAQKVHAREVRIDQQGVSFEFELVTVRAEISHAHTVARCAGRIGNNQMRIRPSPRAESLRSESEKKEKTAHPTTDNANVTDVEEEDANSLARVSVLGVQAVAPSINDPFLLDKRWRSLRSLHATMKGKLKMKKQTNTFKSILLVLSCFAFLPTNASAQSAAGRLLPEFHDGGRVQRASEPHQRGRKYRTWLVLRCLGLAPAVSTPALAPER